MTHWQRVFATFGADTEIHTLEKDVLSEKGAGHVIINGPTRQPPIPTVLLAAYIYALLGPTLGRHFVLPAEETREWRTEASIVQFMPE